MTPEAQRAARSRAARALEMGRTSPTSAGGGLARGGVVRAVGRVLRLVARIVRARGLSVLARGRGGRESAGGGGGRTRRGVAAQGGGGRVLRLRERDV